MKAFLLPFSSLLLVSALVSIPVDCFPFSFQWLVNQMLDFRFYTWNQYSKSTLFVLLLQQAKHHAAFVLPIRSSLASYETLSLLDSFVICLPLHVYVWKWTLTDNLCTLHRPLDVHHTWFFFFLPTHPPLVLYLL